MAEQRAAMAEPAPVTLDVAIAAFHMQAARMALLRALPAADLLAARDALEAQAEADWSVWSYADRAATVREYGRVLLALGAHFPPPTDATGWPLPTEPRTGTLAYEHGMWTTGHGIQRERRQRLYNLPNPLRLSMPK